MVYACFLPKKVLAIFLTICMTVGSMPGVSISSDMLSSPGSNDTIVETIQDSLERSEPGNDIRQTSLRTTGRGWRTRASRRAAVLLSTLLSFIHMGINVVRSIPLPIVVATPILSVIAGCGDLISVLDVPKEWEIYRNEALGLGYFSITVHEDIEIKIYDKLPGCRLLETEVKSIEHSFNNMPSDMITTRKIITLPESAYQNVLAFVPSSSKDEIILMVADIEDPDPKAKGIAHRVIISAEQFHNYLASGKSMANAKLISSGKEMLPLTIFHEEVHHSDYDHEKRWRAFYERAGDDPDNYPPYVTWNGMLSASKNWREYRAHMGEWLVDKGFEHCLKKVIQNVKQGKPLLLEAIFALFEEIFMVEEKSQIIAYSKFDDGKLQRQEWAVEKVKLPGYEVQVGPYMRLILDEYGQIIRYKQIEHHDYFGKVITEEVELSGVNAFFNGDLIEEGGELEFLVKIEQSKRYETLEKLMDDNNDLTSDERNSIESYFGSKTGDERTFNPPDPSSQFPVPVYFVVRVNGRIAVGVAGLNVGYRDDIPTGYWFHSYVWYRRSQDEDSIKWEKLHKRVERLLIDMNGDIVIEYGDYKGNYYYLEGDSYEELIEVKWGAPLSPAHSKEISRPVHPFSL